MSLSRKRVREKSAWHAEADCGNPEEKIDSVWGTSLTGEEDKGSWKRKERRESSVFSGKRKKAQKWKYCH